MRKLEQTLQIQIFQWASLKKSVFPELRLLNASQNGLKTTSRLAGYRAKIAGLKKGFPDLFLPIARHGYHGLFIELKTKENKALGIKKGVLSKEQKTWLDDLNTQGYLAKVCYGYDDCIATLENYIKA